MRLATVAVESHAIRAHCVQCKVTKSADSIARDKPKKKRTVWASRFKKPSNLVKAMTQAT